MRMLFSVSVIAYAWLYFSFLQLAPAHSVQIRCHDPGLGGNPAARKMSDKKFLVVAGAGAGIGNFLIFFPAAYYFAALTGRVSVSESCVLCELCILTVVLFCFVFASGDINSR
jgi:hypothetical protein